VAVPLLLKSFARHHGISAMSRRRQAAIAERQALGAEAANYARILMAAMLKNPAQTGLTETGPTPQLPAPPDNPDPAADPDDEP
jgi:hypothetical protein